MRTIVRAQRKKRMRNYCYNFGQQFLRFQSSFDRACLIAVAASRIDISIFKHRHHQSQGLRAYPQNYAAWKTRPLRAVWLADLAYLVCQIYNNTVYTGQVYQGSSSAGALRFTIWLILYYKPKVCCTYCTNTNRSLKFNATTSRNSSSYDSSNSLGLGTTVLWFFASMISCQSRPRW